MAPIGIIFTGGPNSVYDPASPQADPEIFKLGIPILGICYGCQLIAHNLGGRVTAATADSAREYGKTETYFRTDCKLFKGLAEAGIKLYGGVSGEADAAVNALLASALAYDPNVRCDHHDHAHGEGGHTCGEHGCGHHSCH